ncbi:MAG: hypothetical protein RL215_2732 [Planctomycetota bacterium]
MTRLLPLLAIAAALSASGCQDSGGSAEYVPFGQTAPVAVAPTAPHEDPAATSATAASNNDNPGTAATNTASSPSPAPDADSVTNPPAATDSPNQTSSPATAENSGTVTNPGGPAPLVTSEQSGLSGPADRPAVENSPSAQPRPIQLLIPSKRFRKERPSNAFRVSYDDIDLLKILNMEPVPPDAIAHFPDWLKQLDGQTIRIRGYMYPTFEATGLTSFTLARDNGICCFVRQPKIYDIISVALAPGEVTDYIANRPFDVEGVFRIDPGADQTDLSRLYRIEQAKVLN